MKKFSVVYEDNALIAVNKSAGLLVIPSPKKERLTLTRLLNEYLDRKKITVNAYPCHRIDRETSGIIVYAKGRRFQKTVMRQFKERSVRKTYIAIVRGRLERGSGTIKTSLYNRNKKRYQTALTKYKCISSGKGFSVLEVQPVTGRTNQIRIQFARIGNPLLGERVFAYRKDFTIGFKRVALHARSLELCHPVTKRRLLFNVDLPEDMAGLIRP